METQRLDVTVMRHFDSFRGADGKKHDGPSLHGIQEQMPEVARRYGKQLIAFERGERSFVDGSTTWQASEGYEFFPEELILRIPKILSCRKPVLQGPGYHFFTNGRIGGLLISRVKDHVHFASSEKYRTQIAAELIAYQLGLEYDKGLFSIDPRLNPITRGAEDKAALKRIQAEYGSDRAALENAVIAYFSNPTNLHEGTETPAEVGARYRDHVMSHFSRLGKKDLFATLSAAHEPCITALVMHVTGKAYDEGLFGGACKTAEQVHFQMDVKTKSRTVDVSMMYRDLVHTYNTRRTRMITGC
jgi:broad specificity phosphatase PhoE